MEIVWLVVTDFEKTPPDVQELLGQRISQLGLRLEGSLVERFVQQFQHELERKGLKRFRPVCYLTDEWGSPDGQPGGARRSAGSRREVRESKPAVLASPNAIDPAQTFTAFLIKVFSLRARACSAPQTCRIHVRT